MKTIFAVALIAMANLAVAQTQLDDGYVYQAGSDIKPDWMPESVKTDVSKTYLRFPSGFLKPQRVPSLMDVSNPSKPSSWKYSIYGDQMVVDAVVEKAILIAPSGHDQIRIKHRPQ